MRNAKIVSFNKNFENVRNIVRGARYVLDKVYYLLRLGVW